MTITAHSLIKNEERYLWYSVLSVINHVDKVLLWDTGSTDQSIMIAKKLQAQFPDKIELNYYQDINKDKFTDLRQKMLADTKTDWVLILDGDEVWWEASMRSLVSEINKKGKDIDSIVTPFINLVGDIYHYQEEKAGRYKIDGKTGNLTIRAFNRNIPGIHFENPYGKEGLFFGNGLALQEGDRQKRIFCDAPFLHFTHMIRSENSKKDEEVLMRQGKYKYEKGSEFPKDYYYPEAFFKPRPDLIKSPWQTADSVFNARSVIENPLRKIKRIFS